MPNWTAGSELAEWCEGSGETDSFLHDLPGLTMGTLLDLEILGVTGLR